MKDKLTKGFEKLLKEQGAKIVIVCSASEDGKCEEDLHGYCYHCGRDMLDREEVPQRDTRSDVKVGIAVIIEKDGKLLLGRRNKMHSHGAYSWCSPGGHIDYGEDLIDTAKRESREEMGIEIKNIKFAGITNDVFKESKKHYVTVWFKADIKSGEPKSSNELSMVGWYPLDKLPKPLFLCQENYFKKLIKSEVKW